MSIYANLKAAEEMGIERSFAVNCRRRYLTAQLIDTNEALLELADALEGINPTQVNLYYAGTLAAEAIKGKLDIVTELDAIKGMTANPKETITDDMIERARAYPVSQLVDFQNKKAVAWCHEDRRPSMHYMDRTNRAWCPVCDKYFDAIGVLMERDGMRFVEAVKRLA